MTVATNRTLAAQYRNSGDASRNAAMVNGWKVFEGITRTPMVDALSVVEGWVPTAYIPNIGNTEMYTPDGKRAPNVKSGITMGNGIDTGQWSASEFIDAGVQPYLVDKMSMYKMFEAKGEAAVTSLGNMKYYGAGLTEGEVTHVSNVMTSYGEGKLRDKMPFGTYDSFTQPQKNVVMSLSHLYGVNAFSRHEGFQQAVDGDWKGLYNNMQKYDGPNVDVYDTRHRTMAEQLGPSMGKQEHQEQAFVSRIEQLKPLNYGSFFN